MLPVRHLERTARLLLCLLVLGLWTSPAGTVHAQVQQVATLTILRGQVAIVRPNGSSVQPVASGATVNTGDEIRTISKSGALITFFSGTEIEMGEETILVVEQLSKQGDKIDVSLRQVLGATVNRVQSIAGTGSSYEIQAGGAVALVRGTTFAMVGPVTTGVGDVVAIACLQDCTSASTFAGCAMAPFMGVAVVTGGGKVASDCSSFSVDRSADLFNAAFEGITTAEQHFQGDTNGVPAGQVAPGQRQEIDARHDQAEREAQQKDQNDPAPPPSSQPSSPGARPCNTSTTSGGAGVTTTVHDLGRANGTFNFSFDAFNIPDRFEVIYQGHTLLDTGNVSQTGSHNLTYSGTATLVTVIVTGSAPGTAWNYTVGCPS
jgi:hypothetical protein